MHVQPELQCRNFLTILERASTLFCFGYDPPRTCNHSRVRNTVLIALSAPSLPSPPSFSFHSSSFPPFTTFCKDKIKCAPITREHIVLTEYEYHSETASQSASPAQPAQLAQPAHLQAVRDDHSEAQSASQNDIRKVNRSRHSHQVSSKIT